MRFLVPKVLTDRRAKRTEPTGLPRKRGLFLGKILASPNARHALPIALAAVACSLVVDPDEHPRFCESAGVSCGDGYLCTERDDQILCLPIGGSACETDGQCSAATPFCIDAVCVACRENSDCPMDEAGSYCRDNRCVTGCDDRGCCCPESRPLCEEGQCVECRVSSDCDVAAGGRYCFDGLCVPGCDDDGCCCPEGDQCVQNQCRAPGKEECNGLDDDFDNQIDEDFNEDGDAYSSCPFVDPIPDCDDSNRDVHPGHDEVCDGVDNDCDRETDEGDPCGEGFICDLISHECVPEENLCEGDDDCPQDRFCHDDGLCYPREVGFGEACLNDDQCLWGRCLSTGSLGTSGHQCTEICCSEADCPPQAWCADSGEGLRLCAPSEWSGGVDVSCGGESCPICWSDILGFESCHQQCCSEQDCDVGCQFAYVDTPAGRIRTAVCDVRDGTSPNYRAFYEESECGAINDIVFPYCGSGLHWILERDLVLNIPIRCLCTAPCCSDDQCTDDGAFEDARCVVPLPDSVHSVCYPVGRMTDLGDVSLGDDCHTWRDCSSGVCHPLGYCTVVCCPGTDCPLGGRCEPVNSGGGSTNLCSFE